MIWTYPWIILTTLEPSVAVAVAGADPHRPILDPHTATTTATQIMITIAHQVVAAQIRHKMP